MDKTKVLFLCTGNSARSIMAEALLKDIGGEAFDVYSAGTHPKGIHPMTQTVLAQAHLETAGLESKDLTRYLDEDFDTVITVCDRAAENCPVFPGDPERIHWSFTDPAAVEGSDVEKLATFQETMREMRNRVTLFVAATHPQRRRLRKVTPIKGGALHG